MPSLLTKYLLFSVFSLLFVLPRITEKSDVFNFKFKGKVIRLDYLAAKNSESDEFFIYSKDTMSNVFYEDRNYIEIIRQDDEFHPSLGIAMGFEFDERNGDYPYTPAVAVAQLKDFAYGGVAFEKRDTCNYTGVSNEVSNDITLEIDGFENDTIFGRFTGLLLNGAGKMAAIEEGQFKIHLVRVK
jgi:hypothetical protein